MFLFTVINRRPGLWYICGGVAHMHPQEGRDIHPILKHKIKITYLTHTCPNRFFYCEGPWSIPHCLWTSWCDNQHLSSKAAILIIDSQPGRAADSYWSSRWDIWLGWTTTNKQSRKAAMLIILILIILLHLTGAILLFVATIHNVSIMEQTSEFGSIGIFT